MDTEILQSVLTEILEEQKANLKATKDLIVSINDLTGKMDSVYQNLEQPKKLVPLTETKLVQATLSAGIRQIQATVEAQPKNTVRQFRFLLFPEQFAEQYYRIVFGRLLFWMMIFLIATYLFVLGKQSIDGSLQVRIKQLETNQYKKAWYYLYNHNKKLKQKMDSAWVKSWEW